MIKERTKIVISNALAVTIVCMTSDCYRTIAVQSEILFHTKLGHEVRSSSVLLDQTTVLCCTLNV